MSIFNRINWFNKKNIARHEDVFTDVKSILDSSSGTSRRTEFIKYARLYGNLQIPMSYGLDYSYSNSASRLTLNVIKSCADTLTSKITQQVPSVMFLTDGEDFYKQQKAMILNKFINGAFYAMKFKVEAKRAFLDASIFGVGAVKIIADKANERLICERTIPLELFFDDFDAMYGKPRNLYQRKIINKNSLASAYPKYKVEIDVAKSSEDTLSEKLFEQTDVVEAWHLPSAPNKEDGRHVICIENATLLDEVWEEDDFPFIFLHFTDPLVGFWPSGLGELLIGLQLEINKTLKVIRKIMEYSVPKLVIPAGSTVASQKISNYVMDIIKVVGGGGNPQVMQLAQANPQLFQYLNLLYQRAFEIAGISELSAQAKKPVGLNSGRAIRNFYQIESERYAVTEQKWEEFFVDGARLALQEAAKIKNFFVINISKEARETISLKDIRLKKDEYKIQAFPVSSLPKTPAGRLETITDLIQAGFVTREQGMELLNFPDIERVTDLDLSARRLVRKIVDKIVLKGDYTSPELFFDLAYCIEYSQKSYTMSKLHNIPQDRMDLLVKFIKESQGLIDQLTAPPPEQVTAPQAKPEQAPTSDLLMPNLPGMPQVPGMPPTTVLPEQLPVEPLPGAPEPAPMIPTAPLAEEVIPEE